MKRQRMCVLGDGAFGTAFALLLADNGYSVSLWCHTAEIANAIRMRQCNEHYLPGITLPVQIIPTTDIGEALVETQWIFEAVPVKYLRAVIEKAKPYTRSDHQWIVLSKGIEANTLKLPNAIIDTTLGYAATAAILSGPSFARDLALKNVTAITLAVTTKETGDQLTALLSNTYFRPSLSYDIIGTQMGGALKNVVAIAMGMLDGAGYADTTKALVLTHGLHEMVQITEVLGGTRDTVYGLSGLGDLVLTCSSSLSKNFSLGKQIGAGYTMDHSIALLGNLPEGVNTALSVHQLAQKLDLELPLLQGVYRILFEHSSLEAVLGKWLSHYRLNNKIDQIHL